MRALMEDANLVDDTMRRLGDQVMRRLARMAAGAALVAGLGHGNPAAAATVFSNHNSTICTCGFAGPLFVAEGFTTTGDFDLVGAGVFLQNMNSSGATETASIALYSSKGLGSPGASLWASGPLDVPGPKNNAVFLQEPYNGAPIRLHIATEYFLVVELPDNDVAWLSQGNSPQPFFSSTDGGASWAFGPAEPLQFAVFGTPLAEAVPEPATWATILFGFAGLAWAGRRARRKIALV